MRIWLQVSFLNVYRKLSRTNWDDDLNITQRTFIYFTGWNCQPVMVTFRHCFLAPTKPQTHTDTHSLNHSFETKTWKWSRWPLRNFKQHKNGIAAVAPGCFRGLVWNLSPWGMRVLNDVNCLIIFFVHFFLSNFTMYYVSWMNHHNFTHVIFEQILFHVFCWASTVILQVFNRSFLRCQAQDTGTPSVSVHVRCHSEDGWSPLAFGFQGCRTTSYSKFFTENPSTKPTLSLLLSTGLYWSRCFSDLSAINMTLLLHQRIEIYDMGFWWILTSDDGCNLGTAAIGFSFSLRKP